MLWNASIPILPAWHILLFQLNYTSTLLCACTEQLCMWLCRLSKTADLFTIPIERLQVTSWL